MTKGANLHARQTNRQLPWATQALLYTYTAKAVSTFTTFTAFESITNNVFEYWYTVIYWMAKKEVQKYSLSLPIQIIHYHEKIKPVFEYVLLYHRSAAGEIF